eukprot:1159012-Pelagomonas_calceolata.AAC.3
MCVNVRAPVSASVHFTKVHKGVRLQVTGYSNKEGLQSKRRTAGQGVRQSAAVLCFVPLKWEMHLFHSLIHPVVDTWVAWP